MHNFGEGLVGFIQFRGRWSKGGEGIFSKFRGGGVWTLDEAMLRPLLLRVRNRNGAMEKRLFKSSSYLSSVYHFNILIIIFLTVFRT